MIPMIDLKVQYEGLKEAIDTDIHNVLERMQFILGPNVAAFEQECADYLGVKHAVSCASGTDALALALRAAGIGPGDEVITTPFTFIATAEAIRYVGARAVFVDIDEASFNMDPDKLEQAITHATRALLPVHLFGQPADMPRLLPICEAHDLIVIEDCAQSFGAHIQGRRTGSFGALGCFSFYPSKNLGCYGDGGLLSTGSETLAEALQVLRNHGSRRRYYHDIIGYNSRLDELQAAILRTKLRHIERFNEQRRRVARTYDALLTDLPVTIPADTGIGYHVYHQYTILTPQRDRIMQRLADAGIASAIYYPVPLHRQPALAEEGRSVQLPLAERVAAQCLSLPMYPELPAETIETICEGVKRALT